MIESLPQLAPDCGRSAMTRARCHARLAARRREVDAANRAPGRIAERLLVAGICVAYLIAMAGDLLAVAARR